MGWRGVVLYPDSARQAKITPELASPWDTSISYLVTRPPLLAGKVCSKVQQRQYQSIGCINALVLFIYQLTA